MDLHAAWYVLLGLLLAGYAVLDGFDLGVGILHPLARTDRERRIFLNAIGPIWDGNEVWLIVFGGALFAVFPEAYATVFSGFYAAFMVLLFALILRAVSIEFRSKKESPIWRAVWDASFSGSSLVASIIFGVAVGNALSGIPLDEGGNHTGGFFDLLRPFPLLVGALVASLFAMHGSIFLALKVPRGPLHDRILRWNWHTWGVFLVVYLFTTIGALVFIPMASANFGRFPWLAGAAVVLSVLGIANIPRAIHGDRPFQAFLSSAAAIFGLVGLLALALWPNLVAASNDPARSLTVHGAASSPGTLWITFLVAMVGMPFVLIYTAIVYWTFRGRVEIHETSY